MFTCGGGVVVATLVAATVDPNKYNYIHYNKMTAVLH